MNEEQKAAFVFSQSVCALAEIEGMKAENDARKYLGQQVSYQEDSFAQIADKYGIGHNAVLTVFHG